MSDPFVLQAVSRGISPIHCKTPMQKKLWEYTMDPIYEHKSAWTAKIAEHKPEEIQKKKTDEMYNNEQKLKRLELNRIAAEIASKGEKMRENNIRTVEKVVLVFTCALCYLCAYIMLYFQRIKKTLLVCLIWQKI